MGEIMPTGIAGKEAALLAVSAAACSAEGRKVIVAPTIAAVEIKSRRERTVIMGSPQKIAVSD
jgi:hypothetical protein